MSNEGGPPSIPSYLPPPQFKLLNTPPLLHEGLPDNAELWLVRIQDSHLGTDEFKGKRVTLALNSADGRMGCFESSKGSQFEILDLHDVAGVQPFAFLPKGDSSLEVSKVSRQVAIVRSLDPVALNRSSEANGNSNVRLQQQVSSIFDNGASASLSTGVGGLSTVESLQDDEERISNGKVGKPGKKSKRDELNSELDLSPVVHSHKDTEEHTSSKKKSRKHRKIEGQSEYELNLELDSSPVVLSHKDMAEHTSSKKKSRKHRKIKEGQNEYESNSELDSSPVVHSHKDMEEHTSSKKKSRKHRKIKEGQNE